MKTKTVTEIDYRELETLVEEKLGFKDYSFVATEECGNDSTHEFSVNGVLDVWEEGYVKEWERGEQPLYTNGAILNKLCQKGFIPKGEYLVGVCW